MFLNKSFFAGFLICLFVVFLVLWFTRKPVATYLYDVYGQFKLEDKRRVVLSDFELIQNGKDIGKIKAGATIQYIGSRKDTGISEYVLFINHDKEFTAAGLFEKNIKAGKMKSAWIKQKVE